MASWDRQPGEPGKAYQHFTIARDLGPDRTLPKVSQISAISLARAKQLSEKYNWVERCDQWDAHLQAIHQRAFVTEAGKRGRQRAQAYGALQMKAVEALKHIDLKSATLAQVATAMKVAHEGMRLEEGLETSRVAMEVSDARVIVARLPAEMRAGLCRILADELDPGAASGTAGELPERVEAGVGT